MSECHAVREKDALVEEWQHLGRARRVTPVTHELESNGEHREDVYAGGAHAVVRILRGLDVERSRRIAVRENAVARVAEREREECRADLHRR